MEKTYLILLPDFEPSVKHRVAPGKRSMISWKYSWKMSETEESLSSLVKSRMTWGRDMSHLGMLNNWRKAI